jgi:16S rRNA (guanine527-N7)-methyltransferase
MSRRSDSESLRSSRSDASRLAADKARALTLIPVSRETEARLDNFVDCLLRWQKITNLISPTTVDELWTRHVVDSLQLLALSPDARVWIDLGSGAGFPGLVIACALAGRQGSMVHLVESNGKKAAFLREAIRITGAPAVVHAVRIEEFEPPAHADVVTARALAPLEKLLGYAYPLLKSGAVGLFPKGQDVEAELTAASKCWTITAESVPSKTTSDGRIVIVRHAEPISAAQA